MATARRGKRRRPAEQPEEETELEPRPIVLEPAGGGDAEPEEDVLGELDDESRFVVSIFRRAESGPKTGKPEYVARMSPAEFSLDTVRERFGGGTFEFRVLRKDDRTGRERYHRTRTVHIAGAPRPIVVEGGPPAGAPVAVVGPNGADELRLIREELANAMRANRQLRRRLEAITERPATSPLEWVTALAPILAPFLKPSRSGTEEFVRMLELGVKLGGRAADGESPLGPVVDKALGVVQQIMANGHGQNGAALVPAGGQAAPVPAIAPNGATSPAVHKVAPLWLQRAHPYFPVLHAWARAGDDPAARVGFLLGVLDATTRDELGGACEAPDFVPNTLAALPAVFREPAVVTWVTRFLQLVQEELAPEEAEDGA